MNRKRLRDFIEADRMSVQDKAVICGRISKVHIDGVLAGVHDGHELQRLRPEVVDFQPGEAQRHLDDAPGVLTHGVITCKSRAVRGRRTAETLKGIMNRWRETRAAARGRRARSRRRIQK